MDHANSSDTLSKDKCCHSLFFVWAMEEHSVFQYLRLGGRMFWVYHPFLHHSKYTQSHQIFKTQSIVFHKYLLYTNTHNYQIQNHLIHNQQIKYQVRSIWLEENLIRRESALIWRDLIRSGENHARSDEISPDPARSR